MSQTRGGKLLVNSSKVLRSVAFLLLHLAYCSFGIADSIFAVCSLDTGQNAVYWWIPEDFLPGTAINVLPIQGKVSSAQDAEISLRLVDGTEWFHINPNTKTLVLDKAVDRDAGKSRIDAVVECTSLIPKDRFQVNISVQVKIQDVNDNAPIWDTVNYRINMSEELPIGTIIFRDLHATDIDQEGPNSEVHYSVVQNGPFAELFTIPNSWEGAVAVAERIDYETIHNVTLLISAKDSGYPSLESFANLTINIIDVDDLNPRFMYDSYWASVEPEAALGSIINVQPAAIHAVDGDTLNATIVYSTFGENSRKFSIDAVTGTLKLQSRNISDVYYLTIVAAQRDKPERRATAMLKLNNGAFEDQKLYRNVIFNEHAPVFQKPLYHFRLQSGFNSLIGSVKATDGDSGDVVSYALLTPIDFISVGSLTGEISVKPDFRLSAINGSHEFMVLATDNGKPPRQDFTRVKVDVMLNASALDNIALFDLNSASADSGSSNGGLSLAIIISLASVAALFLVVALVLVIYVLNLRQKRQYNNTSRFPNNDSRHRIIVGHPDPISESTSDIIKHSQRSLLQARFAAADTQHYMPHDYGGTSMFHSEPSPHGSQSPLHSGRLLEQVLQQSGANATTYTLSNADTLRQRQFAVSPAQFDFGLSHQPAPESVADDGTSSNLTDSIEKRSSVTSRNHREHYRHQHSSFLRNESLRETNKPQPLTVYF